MRDVVIIYGYYTGFYLIGARFGEVIRLYNRTLQLTNERFSENCS